MNLDQFEEKIRRQPLRTIPPEWRQEILQGVRIETAGRGWDFKLMGSALREYLWPSPLAWGTLAATWLLTIGLNLATPPAPQSPVAEKVALSSQTLCLLVAQHQALDLEENVNPNREIL